MIERWHRFPQFAGLKDSSGRVENLNEFRVEGDRCRFVGDETLLSPALQSGWSGTISGLANVMPQWLVREIEAHPRLPVELLAELRALPQPAVNKAVLHALRVIESAQVILPLEPAEPEQLALALHLLESTLGIRPGVPLMPGY
jgi:dihydrodipicolinate synthase/N-acetylneuraminate lyase